MPTYRNDGEQSHVIIDTNGARVMIDPGKTIETYQHYDLADLVKTADTPRFNPIVAHQDLEAAGAEDIEIEIEDDTLHVEIINKSAADLDVFLGSAANTPAVVVPGGTVRAFADIGNLVDKLVCRTAGAVAAGNIFVIQSRW